MSTGLSPSESLPTMEIRFTKEIQSMMHAFGDNPVPLQSSVNLVETVVFQQMNLILHQVSDIASMRGAKCIGVEDILFLMRKDRVKINRLLNYLAVKDMKSAFLGNIELPNGEGDLSEPNSPPKKRKRICHEFLQTIDQTGELTDQACQPFDTVKHERNVRAELMSQNLDENRYIEFTMARRVSFKLPHNRSNKLRDWLLSKADGLPELPKSNTLVYELLCYLAYETVAQIVDLALLVRQDGAAQPGDAFSYYIAGFTRMPGYYPSQYAAELSGKQVGGAPPITPAEIQEALRRYWSPQLCPWSPFSRTIPECLTTRLLAS